jgi:chromosome segregation ATPase
VQEISALCEELDKQKLLTSSLKKQHEEEKKAIQGQMQEVSSKNDDELLDLKDKILEYNAYIQQIVQEYKDKESELQASLSSLHHAETSGQLLKKENGVLKSDLAGFRERCQDLEREMQIIKGDSKDRLNQDTQMEQELKRVRD